MTDRVRDSDTPPIHYATDLLIYAGQKFGVYEIDGRIEVYRLGKRYLFAVHPHMKKQVLENGISKMPVPKKICLKCGGEYCECNLIAYETSVANEQDKRGT